MRPRISAAVGVAVASAVVLAAPAAARTLLTHQVNVTVTNAGCRLQLGSVSRRNTTILFHVINNGGLSAGIVVSGVKSKFASPHVGASDLIMRFPGPGHYRYRCVRGRYGHPSTVAAGVFTIRKR